MKKGLLFTISFAPISLFSSPLTESIGSPVEAGLAIIIAAGTVFAFTLLRKKEA